MTFLPDTEVRTSRLPWRQCPTFRPLHAIAVWHFGARLGRAVARLSHSPIGVGRVFLHRRKRDDVIVARREMADRVGRAGVAGERESLAAAAAEVDVAPRAASARLLHPGGAAEGIKGRRIFPDIVERMLPYRPEFETGYGLRCVARQHLARGRHVERAPPP